MRWRAGLVVLAVAMLVVAAAVFEPWRLFTSSRVDEAVPGSVTAEAAPGAQEVESGGSVAPTQPVELASGRFVDAEHATTGTARVLEIADGRRFVRLEGLATSDGPDLHVWLTDRPSGGAWGSYDDGAYVRLGELKATHGNQNYEIPADAEIGRMVSVVIWCDRFDVAFGTAAISVEDA